MKFFTLPALLGVALFSVVATAIFSPLVENEPEFFGFEARLAASKAGRLQLYYDIGAGFNEAASSRAALLKSDTPLLYRLPLPSGYCRALRFDPTDNDSTLFFDAPPRIVAKSGRVVRTVEFAELESANQIRSRNERGCGLELVVEPGANDPQLTVAFSPTLALDVRWVEFAAQLWPRALGVFVVLAALLVSLDRAPLEPTENRRQHLLRFAARPSLWFTLVVCAAVLAARRPDAVSTPQFWGEDSVIFYREARLLGAAALTNSYAGYLHTIPRLVAAMSMNFDPRWAPTFFAAVAATLALYVAARTQSARCPLPRHAGCALAVVLVPDAFEVLLNVDNIQWFLAGGLALLLVSADAQRPRQHLHDACVALLFGLTGPFIIVFAPLFVWRAWARRTTGSTVLAVFVVIAAATQLWTIWRHPVVLPEQKVATEALLAVPGMRIGASLLAGCVVPMDFPRAVEIALGVGTLVGVAALAARRGAMRLERIWLALAFAGLLAISLYRCRYTLIDVCHAGFGSRYFFPLQLLAIWLLLAAANDKRRWIARAATAIVLWALALNLPRLRELPFSDLHWIDFAAKIRAGEAVDVPVNPEPWVMSLPAHPSGP